MTKHKTVFATNAEDKTVEVIDINDTKNLKKERQLM